MRPRFAGGRNIAMKVPPHQHAATVDFYRDVLGLEVLPSEAQDSVCFAFGANRLWIDKVATVSQAELWLEIVTAEADAAARVLKDAGVARCDAIEPLPEGFHGFWISSPCGIIHLVDGNPGAEAEPRT